MTGNEKPTALYIDADSLVIAHSVVQDGRYVFVTHTPTGRTTEWSTVTEAKKWIKEWVAEKPHKRSLDHFELDPRREYVGSASFALKGFVGQVDSIIRDVKKAFPSVENVYVCIQGEGNFRKEIASKFVQYKANRAEERPTCFVELKERIRKHYRNACIVIDGEETDDFVVRACYSGAVVAAIDKDIGSNTVGWLYNWKDQSLRYNTDEMRWKQFLSQMLTGDASDNIPGVEKLHEDVREKYGIKTSGVGEKTAEKLLNGVLTERDGWIRVIEAYSTSHPDDWKDRMQDNAMFLWMCRYKGQQFSLATYLQGFGINLEEINEL